MASAAPAAPSPSAPANAPAAQPAPGAAATPTVTQIPDAPVAKARPIKSAPPRLPGVFPDEGDPFPPPPSSDGTDRGARPRDPLGRFTADGSPAEGASAEEHTGEPKQQPQPIKFLGEEFPSMQALEQNVKSLRGQFKPLKERAEVADKAAASARAWKAEADRLSAELEAARGGERSEPATPNTVDEGTGDTGDVPGIDWELYAEIERLAIENGEGWKARKWLQEQNDKILEARLQRALDERFEPIQTQAEKAAIHDHTEKLFANLATYTNGDGSAAFPELSDERAAFEIGRMWVSLGLPRQAALSPQGAIAAIAMYRMAKGMSQGKPADTVPATEADASAAAAPTPAEPTDTSAAAGLDEGRPSVMRPGAVAGRGPSAEAAAILQGLRSTHLSTEQINRLGFEP